MVGAGIWFLLLVQAPAQADDPPVVAATLDEAIRAISGIDRAKEAAVIGDEDFLRRIFKDLLGGTPSADELKAFVGDPDPAKRVAKVAQLVDDDRFADFWARRFSEVFFGDPEKLHLTELQDNPPGAFVRAVKDFERWFRSMIRKEIPWTEIVASMIDARGSMDGDPALAYVLSFNRGNGLPREFAEGVSRHLLGIRLNCAGCHDHAYDKWRVEDYYGLGAFIVRQRVQAVNGVLEVKYADTGELSTPGLDPAKGAQVKLSGGSQIPPQFLFGGKPGPVDDRMKALAGFMTSRANRQLPRALVNRVWSWLFGYGIVHPVDDFALTNRPMSPVLMEALVRDTVDHKYSIKRLVRIICATKSYAMATPEEDPNAASFRHLAWARAERGRYRPAGANPPALPLNVDIPAAFVRMSPMDGAKALYLARGKGDPRRPAVLTLYAGRKDKGLLKIGVKQFLKPANATQPLEGKLKGTLGEISGLNTCVRGEDATTDYTVLAAVVEASDGPYTFGFEGPSTVVNEWRDEFVAMVKGASSK